MESKLEDFALLKKLPWVETFYVESALPEVDPEDDLKREDAMYICSGFLCLMAGFLCRSKQLSKAANCWYNTRSPSRGMLVGFYIVLGHRPNDYYAEMLKTDGMSSCSFSLCLTLQNILPK